MINLAEQKYTHPHSPRLAEEAKDNEDLQTDLLIGSDHYWDFLPSIERIGKVFFATYTRLGWVFSGPVLAKDCLAASINHIFTYVLRVETELKTENSDFEDKFGNLGHQKKEELSVYSKQHKRT